MQWRIEGQEIADGRETRRETGDYSDSIARYADCGWPTHTMAHSHIEGRD
jgi:hypothetical protein